MQTLWAYLRTCLYIHLCRKGKMEIENLLRFFCNLHAPPPSLFYLLLCLATCNTALISRRILISFFLRCTLITVRKNNEIIEKITIPFFFYFTVVIRDYCVTINKIIMTVIFDNYDKCIKLIECSLN